MKKGLESPQEAASLGAVLTGLRRWLRWKRRAMEVGVALPDATILVRGLNRIIKNPNELNFPISTGQDDFDGGSDFFREETYCSSILAGHLVAEIEQVIHLDLKKKEEAKPA